MPFTRNQKIAAFVVTGALVLGLVILGIYLATSKSTSKPSSPTKQTSTTKPNGAAEEKKVDCIGNCTGKICGPDGCGGSCGTCPDGKVCSPDGKKCADCTRDCTGKICGPDGCGGSCGTCKDGNTCFSDGTYCGCLPDCDGKVCGLNGCGGLCGTCPDGKVCSWSDGKTCRDCTDCTGKICGNDDCVNVNACGTCPDGRMCSPDGKSCSNPPEIYYYNPNTGGEYTKISADAYSTNAPNNAYVAGVNQVYDEYRMDDGLDSCYLGWTSNSFGSGKNYLTIVNPYRTQIPGSTFCSTPNTNNINKDPSTSKPYEDKTQSAGLYLYGVKPNLPDCNNSKPNNSGIPCVGRYNKYRMSKYDP